MVFKCQEDSFLKETKLEKNGQFKNVCVAMLSNSSKAETRTKEGIRKVTSPVLDMKLLSLADNATFQFVSSFKQWGAYYRARLDPLRGFVEGSLGVQDGARVEEWLYRQRIAVSFALMALNYVRVGRDVPEVLHGKQIKSLRREQDNFDRTSLQYSSKVLKCEKTKEPIVDYGKTSKFEGYQVILENTILFPAGGGQPHDIGWLNDKEVLQVLRKGDEAVHFTKEAIAVGEVVTQKINWERRFDHMQQHSGQHLLSAILEKEHNLLTTSWWLGAEESYVELDSTDVSNDVIRQVEERCNELIRLAMPVRVKMCKIGDPNLDEAHTRGLPKDCMETIRIICIENIDENMCCGTHVSNLSQLQMIKLTGSEPGKKGKTNLKFLVGHRVTKTLHTMLERERALTALLKNEPSKHEELVQKLQKNLKISNKNLQNVLTELAQYEIDKIKSSNPKPKYVFMLKKEATPEFNRIICKGLEGEDIFVFVASEEPDKPKEGQIMMQGPEDHCSALGQQITELLKGKGAFKHGKFQGKAGDLGAINKCKKLVQDYFNNL